MLDWPLPGFNVTDRLLLSVNSPPPHIFCICSLYQSLDSVVIMIRLRADQSGDRIPARARDLPLQQNDETGSGTHLISYSLSTAVLYRQLIGRGVKLTDHVHLMSKLRMSRDTSLILLHAFTF